MTQPSFILCLFLLLAGWQVQAQQADQIIRKGNDLYRQEQYAGAEAAYQEALDKEQGNAVAAFNRANALYRQAKPEEAIKLLDDLATNADEPGLKAKAYYNKGAILSGLQKLEESIEAYKNALRHDPGDRQARENLQKALLELRKKTPPPPKEDKNKQPQQQKKQPQQPKMDQKEAQQRLKLLQQKEKEVQQRLQNEKSRSGGGQSKDW